MPGLITHLIAAIVCLAIIHLIHFKWEYSWSIFAGNFVPDVIKFGASAVKQGTLAVLNVQQDQTFDLLSKLVSAYTNWFTLGFFVLGLTLLLYHFHYIKKKSMEEYDELYAFFLIGIIVHLVLDSLVTESNPWI